MSKSNVYLAAPFFNSDQKTLVTLLEGLITDDYNCYSPSRDGIILKPNASVNNRQKVLDENIHGINNADLIVAVIDGRDMGTVWEMGFAYAMHKPIITMSNTNKPINVMIGMTVIAHATDCIKLAQYLSMMKDVVAPNVLASHYAKVVAEVQQLSRVQESPVY